MLARYMTLCLSVCLSVCHKSVVQSKRLNGSSCFWQRDFLRLFLDCVVRKIKYIGLLQKRGYSQLFCRNLSQISPRHVDRRKCCQRSSTDDRHQFINHIERPPLFRTRGAWHAARRADPSAACNCNDSWPMVIVWPSVFSRVAHYYTA